jgi:hypothetical protein
MTGQLATSYTMFVEVILGVSEIVIIFYSFLKNRIPQTDNRKRTPRTKIANRINHLLDEEDTYTDDYVYSVAKQDIKENGKRPSIRGWIINFTETFRCFGFR